MKLLTMMVLLGGTAFAVRAAEEVRWLTDLPKASAQAKTDKKLVFIEFTGSDWCPPCKLLRSTVLDSPEFMAYAKTNLVLVELDFPNKKPQTEELKAANQELAKKFEVDGFPTVIVMEPGGKQLSKSTGYGNEKPKAFIAEIEKARKKAAASK